MIWNGKNLATIGDIFDAMCEIDNGENREANAAKFMVAYRAVNSHAEENIGYLTGYCGPEQMQRLQALFAVAHPVFGSQIPTASEAFAAGLECS